MEDRRLLSGLFDSFPITGPGENPQPVVSGPGDQVSVLFSNSLIRHVSMDGKMQTVETPFWLGAPGDTAVGPDGHLWIVGAYTPFDHYQAGVVASVKSDGSPSLVRMLPRNYPNGIAVGSDGNLWVTDTVTWVTNYGDPGYGYPGYSGMEPLPIPYLGGPTSTLNMSSAIRYSYTAARTPEILKFTPDGQETRYDLSEDIDPGPIIDGPDGNLWVLDRSTPQIMRITTDGQVKTFALPPSGGSHYLETDAYAGGLAAGPDGNIWISGGKGKIDRITPDGQVTEFPLPEPQWNSTYAIAAGADGNLWFTAIDSGSQRLGRITPDGVVTEFLLPDQQGYVPTTLTTGPDGNLWFTEREWTNGASDWLPASIDRFHPSEILSVSPAPVSPGVGQPFSGPVASFQTAALNPSASDFQATIDWGDNTPSTSGEIVALAGGGFQVVGTHEYLSPGSYPISVTIHDQGGASSIAEGTATATVSIPSVSLVGGLDPATDTGVSGDGITAENQPVFSGTTMPGAQVQVFAQAEAVPQLVFLGQASADSLGAWQVASVPNLPDGSYDVVAMATGPAGRAASFLFSNSGLNPLVIDTVGPQLRSVILRPFQGRIQVRFSDTGSGLAPASLANVGDYTLVGPRRPLVGPRRPHTVPLGRSTLDGSSAVTLAIPPGHRLRRGWYVLSLSPSGIVDRAGNHLRSIPSRLAPRFGPASILLSTESQRSAFWHARRFRGSDMVPPPLRRLAIHRRPILEFIDHIH